MNILMFNYEYPPLGGGGGVAHQMIAAELARRHRVLVVTSAYKGLSGQESSNGVEIHRVPVLRRRSRSAASFASLLTYPVTAAVTGSRLARRESFDIVNGHFAVPSGVASLPAARWAGIPHVISIHGGDIFDPSKRTSPHRVAPVRAVVGAVLRGSAAVVAQSADTRANAYRYYRYDGPIDLIPLGIRIPEIPVVDRSELELPPNRPVAVTVGRLVRRKGLDRLIRVMAEPSLAPLLLVIVGSGPELSPLRRLAQQLGVADRVRFAGWVSDERKWQLLAAADLFVSTSMHEGFGLAYLEAMAAGLPVIAPDHGGQVDFLEDATTGFVTPAEDDGAVRRALGSLLERPSLRQEMGRNNRERVERFRIERCAAEYERLFERVLEDSRPG